MRRETGTESRDIEPGSDQEVQDFLDRLARAVTAGDGPAIAKLWETPAFVVSDEGVHAVAAPKEVEDFLAGAKAQYNAKGITDTKADIQRLQWATDRIALVTVRWPYLDANRNEVGEEAATYTLRRDDQGALRLRVAVMHGHALIH